MVCLYCGGITRVANSRHQKRNNQIWRRRQCQACGATFTSHEAIELESALSVNNQGRLEPFQTDLLLKELMLVMQDRKDAYRGARELLSTIIKHLLALHQKPVFTPQDISRATSEVLKRFNRQAYLRYIAEHPSMQ